MRGLRAALWAETAKLRRSTVGRVATLAITAGIVALSVGMLAGAASGDPQVTAKLGANATPDWDGFLGAAAQITGAGGLLGFGVVLAWMFGREFGDGTIGGLFALPVRRSTTSAAKLLVYAAWAVIVALVLALVLLGVGLAAGLGALGFDQWVALGRQAALAVMTAALAVPVAWAATLGRSVLVGVSTAIAILVVAQISVILGAGGWLPFAAPALWAVSGGQAVSAWQLALLVPELGAIAALTIWAWHRLQLDR